MIDLLSLLKNIQQNSQQLFSCLEQEKILLDENHLDKLNEISAQKQTLLNILSDLDQQRNSISTTEKFNAFIANSQDKTLIKQWELTQQAIKNCQKQNEINGRLLNKRAQINQDVLSLLTGRDLGKDTTYNAHGNQTNKTSLLSGVKA